MLLMRRRIVVALPPRGEKPFDYSAVFRFCLVVVQKRVSCLNLLIKGSDNSRSRSLGRVLK